MNNIGKSRCEKGNDVSQAQRSGPLLLVFNNNRHENKMFCRHIFTLLQIIGLVGLFKIKL